MPFPLSPAVLDELCSLLPTAEAESLRRRDPTAYETHVVAYLAIRRRGARVPHRLRVAVVTALFGYHDRAAAESPRRHPGTVPSQRP